MKKKPESKSYSELMANLAKNVTATKALLPKPLSTFYGLQKKTGTGVAAFKNLTDPDAAGTTLEVVAIFAQAAGVPLRQLLGPGPCDPPKPGSLTDSPADIRKFIAGRLEELVMGSLGQITWQSLSRKICAGPNTFANIRLGIDAEEQDQRVRLRTIHDIAEFFGMSVADFVRPYPEGLGGTAASPQEISHADNLCVDLLVLKRNLKVARKAIGWSQAKMAVEAGVSIGTLRNWETEDATIQPYPSIPQLNRIAQATGYSVASLLGLTTKI